MLATPDLDPRSSTVHHVCSIFFILVSHRKHSVDYNTGVHGFALLITSLYYLFPLSLALFCPKILFYQNIQTGFLTGSLGPVVLLLWVIGKASNGLSLPVSPHLSRGQTCHSYRLLLSFEDLLPMASRTRFHCQAPLSLAERPFTDTGDLPAETC